MSGECNICGVMGCVESNHKETNVSDAKPQSIEQLSSLTLVRILSHHTKDYPAILREFGQACFASGAAARDGEVGRLREALARLVAAIDAECPDVDENDDALVAQMIEYGDATVAARAILAALAPGNGGEKEGKAS